MRIKCLCVMTELDIAFLLMFKQSKSVITVAAIQNIKKRNDYATARKLEYIS